MQAHDRQWTPLHGHTQAVTALAYTVDGMFMLSGILYPPTLLPRVLRWYAMGRRLTPGADFAGPPELVQSLIYDCRKCRSHSLLGLTKASIFI